MTDRTLKYWEPNTKMETRIQRKKYGYQSNKKYSYLYINKLQY